MAVDTAPLGGGGGHRKLWAIRLQPCPFLFNKQLLQAPEAINCRTEAMRCCACCPPNGHPNIRWW